jgi:hypothetical protein
VFNRPTILLGPGTWSEENARVKARNQYLLSLSAKLTNSEYSIDLPPNAPSKDIILAMVGMLPSKSTSGLRVLANIATSPDEVFEMYESLWSWWEETGKRVAGSSSNPKSNYNFTNAAGWVEGNIKQKRTTPTPNEWIYDFPWKAAAKLWSAMGTPGTPLSAVASLFKQLRTTDSAPSNWEGLYHQGLAYAVCTPRISVADGVLSLVSLRLSSLCDCGLS